MYRYDEFDAAFVEGRTAQFADQVARRLSGELSEDQFRPLRLMNGLYLQLHAYMLRIAVPYGTLNSRQMRKFAHIARTYDRGYGHFTTRQNIQFNWPKLKDVPAILAELASVEMHAIQTSGNCIRNTTADQFAGAAADEIIDPRPIAEIIRQWSSLHPEFTYLPRKFKIAMTGSPNDRAAIRFHDIGLQAATNGTGELIRRGVADAIARGLDRVHFHGGEFAQNGGHIPKLGPVELDVLTGGKVAIAPVIGARDMGELAQLLGRQSAVRHCNPEHIGMQLQIEPVHQPQRPELVFAQFARQAARNLVGKLRGATGYESRVKFVISIHDRPHPDAGGQTPRHSMP